MFDEFDEQARSALSLAQEEARALGHSWVGTEHLLLGVLRADDEVVGVVVERQKLTYQRARPFTPQARAVLELAHDEALPRDDTAVAPEHLLVALARGADPVASAILHQLGANAERIRAEVARRRQG